MLAEVKVFVDATSFRLLSFEMVKLVWVIPSDSVFLPFSMCPSYFPVATRFCFGYLALSTRKLVSLDWTCPGWRQRPAFSDGSQY